MTSSVESDELAALLDALTAAWRAGDKTAVLSFMANDPHVAMGGPGGAVPMAVGPEQVSGLIDKLVNPLPPGAGVFPLRTRGFALGDIGWLNSDGELRLPNAPPLPWFITMVLRREAGGWKFLNFGAFAGPAS